ncbi:hypothetical protein HHL16_03135 [Pseudoflavitalea sp. G-6-1-2]|uniref:MGMT family protein n=1 Tax=Pseudoflavitalea sp. G-6-1-2 TaxID=2728841 RepID=UPI00146DFE55|nr:MGMT family protein [Pseudoflavitalea sp. G-6-1-2]NML19848.1 hypothetical protein [Pseudoflavitalea sp. G-6-1-2]
MAKRINSVSSGKSGKEAKPALQKKTAAAKSPSAADRKAAAISKGSTQDSKKGSAKGIGIAGKAEQSAGKSKGGTATASKSAKSAASTKQATRADKGGIGTSAATSDKAGASAKKNQATSRKTVAKPAVKSIRSERTGVENNAASRKKKSPAPTEKLRSVTPSGKNDQTFFELVFEVARQIPKGRVTSYGAIAASLGARSSSRLVGWAMNLAGGAKPKVPAHRVVNRNGMLSGKHHFATSTQMQELLEKEGVKVKNDKVTDFNKLFWDPMDMGE